MEELIKPTFQAKTGTYRLFLILIIDLSVPLNLKENFTLKYMFSQKIHPFYLLKPVKVGWGCI